MHWMALTGLVLLIVGSSLSLLRSSTTVDYYRTMLRDGRDDATAKRFMFGYFAGLTAMVIGMALLLCSAVSAL